MKGYVCETVKSELRFNKEASDVFNELICKSRMQNDLKIHEVYLLLIKISQKNISRANCSRVSIRVVMHWQRLRNRNVIEESYSPDGKQGTFL